MSEKDDRINKRFSAKKSKEMKEEKERERTRRRRERERERDRKACNHRIAET